MTGNPTVSARALASRRNGARSRGPRTAAGRARSARNALTHGLCVRTVLLDDEDAAALAAFGGATRAELAPEGPFQGELVTRIVGAAWRARRADRLEAALLGRIWRTSETKRTRETTPDQRVGFPDATRRRGDPRAHPAPAPNVNSTALAAWLSSRTQLRTAPQAPTLSPAASRLLQFSAPYLLHIARRPVSGSRCPRGRASEPSQKAGQPMMW